MGLTTRCVETTPRNMRMFINLMNTGVKGFFFQVLVFLVSFRGVIYAVDDVSIKTTHPSCYSNIVYFNKTFKL